MKNFLILLLCICLVQLAFASSPKSDPSLMEITRIESKVLDNGDREITYKVGSEAQSRLEKKVHDLCDLENIKYEIKSLPTSGGSLNVKITLKNGLLVKESINKIDSELP